MTFIKNIEKEELQKLFNESNSLSSILRKLGVSETCPNSRRHLKIRMKELDLSQYEKNKIDISPFKTFKGNYQTNDEFFSLRTSRKSGRDIKRRLIKIYNWKDECSECGCSAKWNNKLLVLHVDHINGDGLDNRVENLRLLCPNCHSQTETFAGRNIKNRNISKTVHYCSCGERISSRSNRCSFCNGKVNQKIDWPPIETLKEEIWKYSMVEYSKKLGVSDVALKSHCKKNKIPTPNHSYSLFLAAGNLEECERVKKLILLHI